MSRFTAALNLQLVEDDEGRPQTRNGRVLWRVSDRLAYDVGAAGSGVIIVVEAGTVTDLASIPRIVWSLLPPDGPWTKAAVLHDMLYSTAGLAPRCGHPEPFTREEADDVFREAMAVVGVKGWKATLIWAAVRLAGGPGWGR